MMLVDRALDKISDQAFADLPEFLAPGDVLVLNNTKVFPARLLGQSETGAKIEIFLVREISGAIWEALARPARRLPVGKRVTFGDGLSGSVVAKERDGKLLVEFSVDGDFESALEKTGRTPLPLSLIHI